MPSRERAMEKTAKSRLGKRPEAFPTFSTAPTGGLSLFFDKPNVQGHANGLGVPEEGSHVDVLWPALGTAELGGTGADLLGEFGLGKSLPLPLISELEPDAENLGFFLESLADGWIGELLVEIAVPCVFHLRLFSFAGVRGAVFCAVFAASLDS